MSFPIITDAEGLCTPRLYCTTCRAAITNARDAVVAVSPNPQLVCDRCVRELADDAQVLSLVDFLVGLLCNAGLGRLLRAEAADELLPVLTDVAHRCLPTETA